MNRKSWIALAGVLALGAMAAVAVFALTQPVPPSPWPGERGLGAPPESSLPPAPAAPPFVRSESYESLPPAPAPGSLRQERPVPQIPAKPAELRQRDPALSPEDAAEEAYELRQERRRRAGQVPIRRGQLQGQPARPPDPGVDR